VFSSVGTRTNSFSQLLASSEKELTALALAFPKPNTPFLVRSLNHPNLTKRLVGYVDQVSNHLIQYTNLLSCLSSTI
jgi:hypothetical protein